MLKTNENNRPTRSNNKAANHPDWVFHHVIRFMFDGYPHHVGGLLRRMRKLEGESRRVRELRLILASEADLPTPFGNLCPITPGSVAARNQLKSYL